MIKPIKDNIVVAVEKESERLSSGLYIPESAKEKKQSGKVIAIGKDVEEIKKDDRVIFGKYSGSEIEIEGKCYLIFKEEDVLGIL